MRKPVQKKDTQKGKEVRVRSRQDYTDAVQTHLLEHAERVLVMQSRQIPNDKLLLLKARARIKNSQKCVCLSTHETPKHVCFCFFSLSQSTAGYGKITFCEWYNHNSVQGGPGYWVTAERYGAIYLFCLSPLHAGYLLLSPAQVCVCTCRWEPACSDIAAAAPFGARRAQLHSSHDGPVGKPAWFTVHHIWYHIVSAWVLFIDKDDSLGFCMDVVFAHFLLIVYGVNVLLLGCARKQILKVREPNYTSSVRWHVHQYSAIFLNTLQHCCQGCSQQIVSPTYISSQIIWFF